MHCPIKNIRRSKHPCRVGARLIAPVRRTLLLPLQRSWAEPFLRQTHPGARGDREAGLVTDSVSGRGGGPRTHGGPIRASQDSPSLHAAAACSNAGDRMSSELGMANHMPSFAHRGAVKPTRFRANGAERTKGGRRIMQLVANGSPVGPTTCRSWPRPGWYFLRRPVRLLLGSDRNGWLISPHPGCGHPCVGPGHNHT